MPWYLARVRGKVCVWSTIVDAPISAFHDTPEQCEGEVGWMGARPITALPEWPEEAVTGWNRAGPGETTLDAEGLLAHYGADGTETGEGSTGEEQG